MQVLVDGDIIVFRAGFACEKTAYFLEHNGVPMRFQYKKELDSYMVENDLVGHPYEKDVELEPVQNALHTTKLMIENIKDAIGVSDDELVICVSGPNNFRNSVATIKPYKGNRDKAHRPTHEAMIKEYLTTEWGSRVSDNQEADDDMGQAQWAEWVAGNEEESIIVSLDKDLMMIPGLHYNFVKSEMTMVSLQNADRNFWAQMLMGDSTDNIPGIPGFGPVKANALVQDRGHEQVIADMYKRMYGPAWRDAMTEIGRLIWIRREKDEWWEIPEWIQ